MRILYGVQGTGNGHISRSREVVKALTDLGHQVQVLISGRTPEQLPPLPEFGSYITRRGFTFVTDRGKVRPLRTALQLDLWGFYADIRDFDASDFDLVITDFEPLAARIARRAHLPCIGLGHQYAFCYDIPKSGANVSTLWLVKNFAPSNLPIGLHWHHFGQPLLPPIIPPFDTAPHSVETSLMLVYLPFESVASIQSLLEPFSAYSFHIYGKTPTAIDEKHLHFRPFSREGFLEDLHRCAGVICNAGFELPSEALQLGKKLLVRPLAGQLEQLSNAVAIEKLELGVVMQKLDTGAVDRWLDLPFGKSQNYPNVARLVAEWIHQGRWESMEDLSRRAWSQP